MGVIDHLIYGVPSLDEAAERLAGMGLTSYVGGSHPALGTSNRIVPLGSSYIELLGPAPFAADRWVGWMVRDVVLGPDAVPMQRVMPDGTVLSWRLDGLTAASLWELDPLAPVRIAWDEGVPLPGSVSPIGRLEAVVFGPGRLSAARVVLNSGREVVLTG